VRAIDFLTEIGDKPYQLPNRWKNNGDGVKKSIELPSGNFLEIEISAEHKMALVNFYVGGSQKITGNGDAIKIFSTVGDAINDYARKNRPYVICFTGHIFDDSRIRLYDRLANRWLTMPGLKGYVNLTDHEELWPEDLLYFMDAIQDLTDQKIYVLASPGWMRGLP
jgi:hypothetical protein